MTAKSIFAGRAALFAAAVVAVVCSLPAKADIDFDLSIQSVTGSPGSSGDFDVLLTNISGADQNVAGFSFEITTTDMNITFGNVTTSTVTEPYIFALDSTFGPGVIGSGSGQTVDALDIASDSGVNVSPGETLGIGNVSFSIAGTAMNGEVATLAFTPYPSTGISDNMGDSLGFNVESGTITVSAVPEPSSAVLLGSAILILLGAFQIRRLRRRATL